MFAGVSQLDKPRMNRAIAITLLFLLLDLYICRCQSKTPKNVTYLCHSHICIVSPDNWNIWQLQEIISSNKLIVFNGVKFSVNDSSNFTGFIVIENVSNLTISGGESGSLIECSPQSTFGLHFKNTTNVTLTGIRIRNCGSAIHNLTQLNKYRCPNVLCHTSILIEASRNVNVSRVHIELAAGIALAVVDFLTNESHKDSSSFVDNTNPNRTLTDTKTSHCREECRVKHERTSLMLEKTVITHSQYCILDITKAVIIMKNVSLIKCLCLLQDGRMWVRERLTMTNSSLYINNQDLVICEGRVSLISNSQLVATYGEIIITENSVVVFTEFNTTAHGIIFNGTIVKLENSTLSLTKTTNIWNNTWFIVSSQVDINAGSSIIISKNSDSTYHLESTILKIYTSNITLTGAKLLIENNECETFDGGSGVLETWNTTMKLTERSSVIITQNKAARATISKIYKGLLEIIDSTMTITQNTIIESKGCVYSESSIILNGGELVLEEN